MGSPPGILPQKETTMDRESQYAAKAQMVAQMQAGQSWQVAATSAGVQTSRTAAYRLLQRVRSEGARALRDQRRGHPVKLREPMREWLVTFCRDQPMSTGRIVQAALLERFGLQISISQINRLRAALGVKRPVPSAGEKSARRSAPRADLARGSRKSALTRCCPRDGRHHGARASAPHW